MTWDEIGAATREAVFVVTLGELDQTTIILDLAHMVYPACYGFAGELFDPNVRSSGPVFSITKRFQRLLDAGVRLLVVDEGTARPDEKRQCGAERSDRVAAARAVVAAKLALPDAAVSDEEYRAAFKVPHWLSKEVARWISNARTRGAPIAYVCAPFEADAQCAALMKTEYFSGAHWMSGDNDTIAFGDEDNRYLRPATAGVYISQRFRVASCFPQVRNWTLLRAIDEGRFELVENRRLLSLAYPLAIGAAGTGLVRNALEAIELDAPLPEGTVTFNGWTCATA